MSKRDKAIQLAMKEGCGTSVELPLFLQEWSKQEGVAIAELGNRVALALARQFESGAISFQDADGAINVLYWVLNDLGSDLAAWETAYGVYLAFDAGELDPGDGTDPVELFTRPQIAEILRRTEQSAAD